MSGIGTVANGAATRAVRRGDEIVRKISKLIETGLVRPGARLSSIRATAAEYGVGKNTVADAYDQLVARGYLEARPGSGYYACALQRKSVQDRQPNVLQAIDLVWLLREQLEKNYAVRVGDGRPPPTWMEGSELGRHLKPLGVLQTPLAHAYGSPAGFAPLREHLAFMLAERSIDLSPAQVLITQGGNHALDLIIRHLVQPGDRVLVDSPGYYPLFGKLKLANAEMVGVRRNPEGPDLDQLEAKARKTKAKIFFTQSLAHNPTGNSISIANAHRVLRIAARYGLYVVDSDPFADLLPVNSPRLAAFDQLERVIHVGTFSKTISASLRIGYIAASQDIINALTNLKMVTIVNSSGYVERVVYDLMVSGQFRHHLKRLNNRIEVASQKALATLQQLRIGVFGKPFGGYYLWGELPAEIDDIEFSRRAAEESIFIAPGSLFMADRKLERPAMRVNIAYADDPRFARFYVDYAKGMAPLSTAR